MLGVFIFFIAAVSLGAGTWAQPAEQLGPDGFPAGWKAEDYMVGPVSPTSPVRGKAGPLRSVTMTENGLISNLGTPIGAVSPTPYMAKTLLTKPMQVEDMVSTGYGLAGFGVLSAVPPFTPALWQKAARHVHEPLLEKVEIPLEDKAGALRFVRDAWRRLLQTQAQPPVQMDKMLRKNWLAVRAETLERAGLFDSAWSLWRQPAAVERLADEALLRGWARSAFLQGGKAPEICRLSREKVSESESREDAFWPAMVAACVGVEKQGEPLRVALGLGLQVLPPQISATDAGLWPVLTALRDGKPVPRHVVLGPLSAPIVLANPQILASLTTLPLMPDVALRRFVQLQSATVPAGFQRLAELRLQEMAPLVEEFSSTLSSTLPAGGWPDVALAEAAEPTWRRLLELEVQVKNIPGVLGLVSEKLVSEQDVSEADVVVGVLALRDIGLTDVAKGVWDERASVIKKDVLQNEKSQNNGLKHENVSLSTVYKPTMREETIKKPQKPTVPKINKPMIKKEE